MKVTAMEQTESVSDILCDVFGDSTLLKAMDCNSELLAPVGDSARLMMANVMKSICANSAFSGHFRA